MKLRIRERTRPGHLSRRHLRRGVTYLLAISVGTVLAVIGFAVITNARIAGRATSRANHAGEAGVLAMSAAEQALSVLDATPAWRTTMLSGVESTPLSLGGGTVSYMLVDEGDGNLADDPADPVRLYGIGRVGDAVRAYSVLLAPGGRGLTCLEVAAHAGADFIYKSSTTTSDQILSANAEHRTQGNTTINANVEAVLTITGSGYTGSQTTGITPRTMPDPNTVFDYYVANGTAIAYSDLPGGSMNELLSPASNPYGLGVTNAEGIYVIDCLGQVIRVENCRIVGTLVLLNAGAGSYVYGKLNWEPAVANYPALLVQCSYIYFSSGEGTLDESVVGNMNPLGTPYQGVTDSDATDSYPAIIKGLVYVTGGINPHSAGTFEGVMVAGADINPFSPTILNYNPTFLNNPPPGFAGEGTMVPMPGMWQWVGLPP